MDLVSITQKLIQCQSVTPNEGGALDYTESLLKELGFKCQRLKFGEVDNLYAKLGDKEPNLCFAGHVDVVPEGNRESWTSDPYEGKLKDGFLIGRGAVDMKGAITAFIVAVKEFQAFNLPYGSISLLLTCDEEGPAINGTQKVLEELEKNGEKISFCLVGEPISDHVLGDTIKIGRKGSINTVLKVKGVQGHVAYPERSSNPIDRLIETLYYLKKNLLEAPSEYFAPSNLEFTSIDVGNPSTNVIPEEVVGRFNIRFSDQQTSETLIAMIQATCEEFAGDYELDFEVCGEAEFLNPDDVVEKLRISILEMTNVEPVLSTAGGTSDARFIRNYCPVVEFGLVGRTMHQVNEHVSLDELMMLSEIYRAFLIKFFK